jgi:hypothetical protein
VVLEENWSIAPDRVREFFRMQPDVTPIPQGFQYGSCEISLTPVSGMLMGKWPQARTLLRFAGSEEEVRQIYHRFFLHFLSAGG